MNIKVIKSRGNLYDLKAYGDSVLEVYLKNEGPELGVFLYDTKKNVLTDLDSVIKGYSFLPVYKCFNTADFAYFADYEQISSETIRIRIRQLEGTKAETVCTFEETADILTSDAYIKVFALSPDHFLIQTETVLQDNADRLMGNIKFQLRLYYKGTDTFEDVKDQNLLNNGIASIISVSENLICIKTGYSSLEDHRLLGRDEKDALIESIFLGPVSRFIADLSLGSATQGFTHLSSEYYSKNILRPKCRGDYIFYSVIDYNNLTSDTFFYNYKTEKTITFKRDDIDLSDLYFAYVIKNVPYIRVVDDTGSTQFINLLTTEIDGAFDEEEFRGIHGRNFIFTGVRNHKDHLRIYRMPKWNLIYDCPGTYQGGCRVGEDFYIYI
ncbi:MAG: hypothetical protein HUJ75_00225 [Parasporobacterium sp.]|nr:hypothetical protein [Parasporobacterium sp.]